jgi:hypothetical protein
MNRFLLPKTLLAPVLYMLTLGVDRRERIQNAEMTNHIHNGIENNECIESSKNTKA